MKFNCGDTYKEKQARKTAARVAAFEARKHWHTVFAWWPVRVGPKDCRWLENVERRIVVAASLADYSTEWIMRWWAWSWEYKSLVDTPE